jgi:hypothetical protein
MFEQGQFVFESASAYHSRKEISASAIKTFLRSPEHYYREQIQGIRRASTSSMDLGTTVHDECLLPAWERSYVVIPPEVLSSNGARRGTAWKEFQEANSDKVLIKEQDAAKLIAIRAAMESHPVAKDLLIAAKSQLVEITITANCGEVPVRGRLDILLDDAIVDLKTTSDLSPREMSYRVKDHGWHLQAAMYQELVRSVREVRLPVFFVVVETVEPYRCEIYCPEQSTLWDGANAIQSAIDEIYRRAKSENWHRSGWPEAIYF